MLVFGRVPRCDTNASTRPYEFANFAGWGTSPVGKTSKKLRRYAKFISNLLIRDGLCFNPKGETCGGRGRALGRAPPDVGRKFFAHRGNLQAKDVHLGGEVGEGFDEGRQRLKGILLVLGERVGGWWGTVDSGGGKVGRRGRGWERVVGDGFKGGEVTNAPATAANMLNSVAKVGHGANDRAFRDSNLVGYLALSEIQEGVGREAGDTE